MTHSEPLRAVTSEEVDCFERDGFVLLKRMFPAEWLSPLLGAVKRILASDHVNDVTKQALRYETSSDPRSLFGVSRATRAEQRGRFFVSFNTARREPHVLQFVLSGGLGSIAAALLRSSSVRFCDDILFVKEPQTQEETEWHDDDNYSITTGPQRCSLWCSLDDVSEEGGALRFLSGSHRRFAGWRTSGLEAESLVAKHSSDVVVCPVRRGDVIAHDLCTIHGGGPNRGFGWRRAFVVRFAGEEARFVLPVIRGEARDLYGLQDGDLLSGPAFPLAWPIVRSPKGVPRQNIVHTQNE